MKHIKILIVFGLISSNLPAQTVAEWVSKGLELHRQENYKEAVDCFSHAIQMQPELAAAWYNRANSKMALEQYSLASVDYNRAIFLDTSLINAYFNRAVCYRATANYQFALADLNTFLQRYPSDYSAISERADLCMEMADYKQALSDVKILHARYPDDTEYRKWLIKLYSLTGNPQEAIDTLNVWIVAESDYAFWHYLRALAAQETGDYERSLQDVQLCQLNNPDDRELKRMKAANCFYLKRFDESADLYSGLLAKDSLNADLLADYGHCLLQMHMYSQADSILTRSIRAKNQFPAYAYLGRGIARFNLGRQDDACSDWNKSRMLGEKRAEQYLLDNCKNEKEDN